ncbi:MAG: hypothetical protein H0V00_04890, partial [Chloroflexia bacterium]|nr:hypothetical protein [Chloroflexia bacterium]
AAEAGRPALLGATLGAAGAGLGAKGGYHARVFLGCHTMLPDPVWGAVEDVVAIALGVAVLPTSWTASTR